MLFFSKLHSMSRCIHRMYRCIILKLLKKPVSWSANFMHCFHKFQGWINTNIEHQNWRRLSQLSNGTSPNSNCYLSIKLCIDEVKLMKLNYRSWYYGTFVILHDFSQVFGAFWSLTIVKHVGIIKGAFFSSLGSKRLRSMVEFKKIINWINDSSDSFSIQIHPRLDQNWDKKIA